MKKQLNKGKRKNIFNPKILGGEVRKLGFILESKEYLMYLFIAFILSIVAGKLLYLNNIAIGVLAIFFMCNIPSYILNIYRRKFEKTKFYELDKYMDNMLSSFSMNGKIKVALEDTVALFEENSQMRKCIQTAIDYIYKGQYEQNLYEEALELIEMKYANKRLVNIHKYMISIENNGGRREKTAEILLEYKNNWYNNVKQLQQEKSITFRNILLSIILSIIICLVIEVVEITGLGDKSNLIYTSTAFQVSTTLMLMLQILIYGFANKKLADNWVNREEHSSAQEIVKNYNYLCTYDVKKEQKTSLIWAAPFFIAAVPLYLLVNRNVALVVAFIGFLMLFQHKLNYTLSYKVAYKEFQIAFPVWLTEISILLQENNVQRSIAQSLADAPAILKPEIRTLLERINEKPKDVRSYTKFCEIFKEEDTRSAMQNLFDMAVNGTGNTDVRIQNLLGTIYTMRDAADKIQNNDILASYYFKMFYPTGAVIMKALVEMYLLLTTALPAMLG